MESLMESLYVDDIDYEKVKHKEIGANSIAELFWNEDANNIPLDVEQPKLEMKKTFTTGFER